jgi:hypothetical protein
MQDGYVGDVRDFVKYGLLRRLCGKKGPLSSLDLGVVWYRVRPEEVDPKGAAGGGLTRYLEQPEKWRRLDEELFDALGPIRAREDRTVLDVEESGLLGDRGRNAFFYSRFWTFRGIPRPRRGKEVRSRCVGRREKWQCEALEAMDGADVVFLDPDNGIYTNGCRSIPATNVSLKYVLPGEIRAFFDRAECCLVSIQFLNQRQNDIRRQRVLYECQITDRRRNLLAGFDDDAKPKVETIVFREDMPSPLVFFIMYGPASTSAPERIRHILEDFAWKGLLTRASK